MRVLWVYLLLLGAVGRVASWVLFWKEYFTIKYLTTRAGEVLILKLWQVQKKAWTSTLPSLGLKDWLKRVDGFIACGALQSEYRGLKKERKGMSQRNTAKRIKKLDGRNERFKPCVRNSSLHTPPTCPVNDKFSLTQFLRQSAVPDCELCYLSPSFLFLLYWFQSLVSK